MWLVIYKSVKMLTPNNSESFHSGFCAMHTNSFSPFSFLVGDCVKFIQ